MAHQITETDNMFSVREMPWHRLGVVLEDYPTRAEAQKIAHNWEPISTPIFRKVPHVTAAGEVTEVFEEIENAVAQERSDNGGLIGVTSGTFTPVTNGEMYDVAEALQGENGDVKFETGGSLNGGARVWLMLRLNEPLVVNGDPNGATMHYYMLQNHHNATGAFKGSATATRVVCANTMRIADMDAKAHGTEFAFSHTKNVTQRVEEARQALAGWRVSVEAWKLFTEHMIDVKVTQAGVEEFVRRFIPEPPADIVRGVVRQNIETARDQWWECYNGKTGEGIERTAYGLLQASSEYAEHYRKAQSDESRFKRAILDRNGVMSHAIRLAEEAALVTA